MFDRSTILRDAHAQTRKMRTWASVSGTYREIFVDCLRLSWRAAKAAAYEAAWESALTPIPSEVEAEVAAMRVDAWYEPINAAGNARMMAIFAQAAAIENTARAVAMGSARC